MRFACVLIEHLPVKVETLLTPALAQQALVVLRPWDERVLDASSQAAAAGVGPGDTRRRAEQLCPQAAILPAREALYQARHESLIAALGQFADAVESGDWGEGFVEIGALARTFPSEQALALQLAAEVEGEVGLAPALGIASNKFTALQAARQAAGGLGICVVPAGREGRFLALLPATALPELPAEMLRRLHLFGMTTLGELAALPRPALARQFGAEAVVFHDLARGIDPRPLIPQAPPPLISRRLALPELASERGLVLAALDHLVGQLAGQLEASGFQATALSLAVATGAGQELLQGSSLRPPSADVDVLRRLAARLLGRLPLASPVTSLAVTAYPLREWHAGARQLALLDEDVSGQYRPLSAELNRLWEAVRLLRQRFGEAVIRLASAVGPPAPIPIQVEARPDGMPAWLGWPAPAQGGRPHRVASVYEHWRVYDRWWEQPVQRDYYQVETDGQAVFTVFRDEQGRWFLERRRGGG